MEFSNGNLKLGKDTLIFNMSSATDCPAKEHCLVKEKCYALKAEKQYPAVLPYRRRQEEAWKTEPVEKLAQDIKGIMARKRKNKINFVRFSEAGDFKSQLDVEKLKELARNISEVTFYGYTARKDLKFQDIPENLIINGSGFKVHNKIIHTTKKDLYKHQYICEGNCSFCDLCKQPLGIEIAFPIH